MVKVKYRGETKEATEQSDGNFKIGSLTVGRDEVVVLGGDNDPGQWSFLDPPPGSKIRVTPARDPEFTPLDKINFDPEILEAFGYPSVYRHQAESLEAALDGDVLLAFDVSAGKSFVAHCMAIKDAMETNGQTIYLCPTNALVDNQCHDIADVYEELGIASTIIRGGVPADERNPEADVIFTNFYALDHLLNNKKFNPCNVGTVVLDELHMLAAGAPGGHLRGVLKRLEAQRKLEGCEDEIKYIGLSATISQPEKVFEMVTGRTPVVLSESYAKTPTRTTIAAYRKNTDDEFNVTTALVEQGYSGFVFIDNRNKCEEMAERLNDHFGTEVAGYYHSSMNRGHQRATADKFREGEIKVVVTTSSLEAGVNYPGACQFVVVDCGETIDPSSLAQRAGRAGRDGTPALLYCVVGKNVFSLDWFLDRGSTVVMPSVIPLIDEIHGRRLSYTVRDPKLAAKVFPLASPKEIKTTKNPYREEQLFEQDTEVVIVDQKGAKKLKRVPISSAMANFPPGRVANMFVDGEYKRYEILQLTPKGAIAKTTTNNPNKATPTIITTITDDAKITGQKGTINKDLMMVLGYGKLVDSCSVSAFQEMIRVKVCKGCHAHNSERATDCSKCKKRSFRFYNKKGTKFANDFPVVSNTYTAAFLIVRTEELRSGTAYALARVIANEMYVKEEDIGIAFQGDQTVFYDKHPHSNVVGYLFDNWETVLAEAKRFVKECKCTTGCVACCGVLRGQFVKASKKDPTLDNLQYLSTQNVASWDLSSPLPKETTTTP